MKAIRDAERKRRIRIHQGTEWPSPGDVVFIDVEERGGDVDEHITIGPKALPRVIKALQAIAKEYQT